VSRQRYDISDQQIFGRLLFAVAAAARRRVGGEDDVDAGEVGVERPVVRVTAEISDEDEDLEGAREGKSEG
jgi:hypothetical protein